MADLRRIRIAHEKGASLRSSEPVVVPSDPDIDLLLARIRRRFDVRAAVVGLAGDNPATLGAEVQASTSGSSASHLRICASVPLRHRSLPPLGILILADIGSREMSGPEMRRLSRFADELSVLITQRRDANAITELHGLIEARDRLIEEQAAALAHSRKVFEQSSAAARIGVWECTLPGESLYWTDGVYDIFDIPRGSPIRREDILPCYPPETRAILEAVRSRAIAEGSGFSLDAEIVTKQGRPRWIRLTATVECEAGVPVRVFGMKQDITEEKTLADRTRYLAEFDVMTGLANRAQFQSRLDALTASRAGTGALLLIDLDGFKLVNDTHGHAAGDACLREAALRLRQVCAGADLVARIGGDEFAVMLGTVGSDAADAMAASIVEALGRPIERDGRVFRLGASVGIAQAVEGAPTDLFTQADAALYAAKAAGRGTFRSFAPEPVAGMPLLPPAAASETLPNRHAAASPP